MQIPLISVVSSLVVCAALSSAPSQDKAPDMAAMMQQAAKFIQPGEPHKVLEKFVGKWDSEMRMFMGSEAIPGGKGVAEFTWLMPGRYVQMNGNGSMMNQPMQSFYLLGYDNFKQSYVTTALSSLDTAMLHFEGDLTQDKKSLISYGTLDEYLTGEHDKMVKTVWRFVSADKLILEVHDLPIGETNTKVFEIEYTRAK
ncbi:MAG: DUF1579 family protein [Planctomycetota bacterium]|nr:DUF1579 family protein [Planctomycetota bacterium]